MTKKNEMPIKGLKCSKCNSSDLVMNTDTKEIMCANCGETVDSFIIDDVNSIEVKCPTITITDNRTATLALEQEEEKTIKPFFNAQRIEEQEEHIEKLEDEIKYRINCLAQHIEELYGYAKRLENHIEDLESDSCRMFKEQGERIKELEDDLKSANEEIDRLTKKMSEYMSSDNHWVEKLDGLDKELREYKSESYERMVNLEFAVKELRDRLSLPDTECKEEKPLTFGDLELGEHFNFIEEPDKHNEYIKVQNLNGKDFAFHILANTFYETCGDRKVIRAEGW